MRKHLNEKLENKFTFKKPLQYDGYSLARNLANHLGHRLELKEDTDSLKRLGELELICVECPHHGGKPMPIAQFKPKPLPQQT